LTVGGGGLYDVKAIQQGINPGANMTKRDWSSASARDRLGATASPRCRAKNPRLHSAAVAKGETVELRNFGVFEVKVRKARVGRNPNAPATDVPSARSW